MHAGHKFIDLLKVDVEGYEFPSLRSFFQAFKGRPLPIGQLQLEIHVGVAIMSLCMPGSLPCRY